MICTRPACPFAVPATDAPPIAKNRGPTPAPQLFDHHYRFAVNTRIAANQAGRVIREGDRIDAE